MEICLSSLPWDKQRKKTPLVIKTATYQSGTIRLFPGSLLAFCGTSFRFYPKRSWGYEPTPAIPPLGTWEDFWTWRTGNGDSQACTLGRMKPTNWNLLRLISYKCLITEDRDLSPDQKTPAKHLSPSSSQWTCCLDSGWTPWSLHSLPMDTTHPKPSMTYLWLVQHAFGELQLLCYSWKKQNKTQFLLFWACLSRLLYLSSQIQIKRNWKQGLNGDLYNRVCSDIIHSSQQAESTQARAHQKMNG